MMIKIKLDEVFKDKNVLLIELLEVVDIMIVNLLILKIGKVKVICFSMFEVICNYLEC